MPDTFDESADQEPQSPQARAESAQNGRPSGGEIDIRALADKVYRLMLAEIRLDRARGEPALDGA
jgi:hypothetical protein